MVDSAGAALTEARRDDLQHGSTPAYVRGCVCKECREYQSERMAKNRKGGRYKIASS
jgi:hypothetical protein